MSLKILRFRIKRGPHYSSEVGDLYRKLVVARVHVIQFVDCPYGLQSPLKPFSFLMAL